VSEHRDQRREKNAAIWAPIIARAKARIGRRRHKEPVRSMATAEEAAYWMHRDRHECHPGPCDERLALFNAIKETRL
jgi:hypothetical protein